MAARSRRSEVRASDARTAALAAVLESVYARYDRPRVVDDPVECIRSYADVRDREIAGFFAAGLAFGNVKAVMRSVRSALAAMGRSPAEFVGAFRPSRDSRFLSALVHRWIRGADLNALCLVLRETLLAFGSIERAVANGMSAASRDVGDGLEAFGAWAGTVDVSACYVDVETARGVGFFLPRPSSGSACKRLNLYLRWMVRHDGVDPGGWRAIAPRHLVMPLDVHIIRIGRCLRLTSRRTPGWSMAQEITDALRRVDPDDPVRFDFALCHLGMDGACGDGLVRGSANCPFRGHCRPVLAPTLPQKHRPFGKTDR